MSRIFLKTFLVLFLILVSSGRELMAQITISRETIGQSDGDTSLIEVGLRGGLGFRSKDRFENNLENFASTFQPGIYSTTQVDGFRNQDFGEFLLRFGYGPNQRFGFVLGSLNYDKSHLTEFTSDGYYTKLDFSIKTNYLILTYHYQWNLSPKWAIEAGLGFGGNETNWTTAGLATNGNLYYPQKGRLRGSGISLRMENSLQYRVNDVFFLQIGWMVGLHSIPGFSGSWNGSAATFYIREDGKTSPISESRVTDTIVITNQFARALDMNSAHAGIYFSGLLRFYY